MKVLFIGGSGTISTEVSKRAVEVGIDLYVLNRGKTKKDLPKQVTTLIGDIHNPKSVDQALKGLYFDAVVQWVAFTKEDVLRDYDLFKDKTKQYVFISSASAYKKPVEKTPIDESAPLGNPYWEYSQNKQAAEEVLMAMDDQAFNVTIVRPSHTYDDDKIVAQIQSHNSPYSLIQRILEGKSIVVAGNGQSKWTLTHAKDFAKGFVDLLGNEKAYHEIFNLTSEKVYTWDEIITALFDALNVPPKLYHIPIDVVLKHFPQLKGELLGDKMINGVFDNTKIKQIAPNYTSAIEYPDVLKKTVKRYLDNEASKHLDKEFLTRYQTMIDEYLKTINM